MSKKLSSPPILPEVPDDLNERERLFVEEYVTGAATGKRFHAAYAATHAGYTVDNYGYKLKKRPRIQAYIAKVLEAHSLGAMEVFAEISEIAKGHGGAILTKDSVSGRLMLDVDGVMRNKHLVESFEIDSNGNPKIKYVNRFHALQQLARMLGMNQDSVHHLHSGGINVNISFHDPNGEIVAPDTETIQDAQIIASSNNEDGSTNDASTVRPEEAKPLDPQIKPP